MEIKRYLGECDTAHGVVKVTLLIEPTEEMTYEQTKAATEEVRQFLLSIKYKRLSE